MPTMQLGEVVVLEGGVEAFEELIKGIDSLIGQLGEDEAE